MCWWSFYYPKQVLYTRFQIATSILVIFLKTRIRKHYGLVSWERERERARKQERKGDTKNLNLKAYCWLWNKPLESNGWHIVHINWKWQKIADNLHITFYPREISLDSLIYLAHISIFTNILYAWATFYYTLEKLKQFAPKQHTHRCFRLHFCHFFK